MATHYVRSDAEGGGDGSADTPAAAWTLAEYQALAAATFTSGDEVVFTGAFSMSGTAPLVFKQDGLTLRGPSATEYAYFDVVNTGASSIALSTDSKTNPKLQYVDLTGQASYALLGSVNAATTICTFDHVRVHDNRGTGGGVRCENNSVALNMFNMEVSRCASFGVIIKKAGAITVRNLTLNGNGTAGAANNNDQFRLDYDAADETHYNDSCTIDNVIATGGLGGESSDFDLGRTTTVTGRNILSIGPAGKSFSAVQTDTGGAMSVTLDGVISDGARIACFPYSANAGADVTFIVRNATLVNAVQTVIKVGSSANTDEGVKVEVYNTLMNGPTIWQVDSDAPIAVTADYNAAYGYTTRGRVADANDVDFAPQLNSDYLPSNGAVKGAGVWIAGVRAYGGVPLPLHPDIGAVQDLDYPGRKTAVAGVL